MISWLLCGVSTSSLGLDMMSLLAERVGQETEDYVRAPVATIPSSY